MTLAPQVHLTRLPFGGAVLVCEVTLEMVELMGPEADRLTAWLSGGPVTDHTLAEALTAAGWLLDCPMPA